MKRSYKQQIAQERNWNKAQIKGNGGCLIRVAYAVEKQDLVAKIQEIQSELVKYNEITWEDKKRHEPK